MVFERLRTTAPLTADPGLASARKRKGCDDDRDSNRQTERERRDSGQADVYSRPQQSRHSTPTTNGVFESRGTKSSRPPRNLPTTRKTRPFQIQSRRPKKGPCKYFFIRGFSRTKPVNKGAAKDMLHDLQQLSCLDDLFAIAPEETFRVARGIVDSFYNSISVFEDRVFQRDTPPGRELVGRIGLFIVPQLRGDPRPLNSKDNNYLLPGPHDTDIMVKITPALIHNNDHHQHINIRTFTTKHNSDTETLENFGELKRDFVLMCQTSDDDHDDEAMHTSKPQCFTSLKFVPTSDSFEYKSPCYMSITDSQTYSRRCPWMDLGYLADGNDHITLDKILQEASTRLAAPNLEKIAKLARTALNTSSSNSIQKSTATNNGTKSPSAPVQTQNITTLTAKTQVVPADADVKPLNTFDDITVKLSESIEDMTIVEYVRSHGISSQAAVAIQRLQDLKLSKPQNLAPEGRDAEARRLQDRRVDTLKGNDDEEVNKRGKNKRRKMDP